MKKKERGKNLGMKIKHQGIEEWNESPNTHEKARA